MNLDWSTSTTYKQQATDLHHLICSIASSGTFEESSRQFEQLQAFLAANKDDPLFIFFTPHNHSKSPGYSHLADCVYLPFRNTPENPELQTQKAIALFSSLTHFIQEAIQAKKIEPKHYTALLSKSCNQYYSLLLSATNSGSTELTRVVFNEVKAHLSEKQYAALLTLPNKEGFTILHDAVNSGNMNLVRFVFNEVKAHVHGNLYRDLLETTTKEQFSILHDATISGNAELTRFIFAETKHALDTKRYDRLLQASTKAGFSSLHYAINSDNPDLAHFVFEEVKTRLPQKRYAELLAQRTKDGLSLLHLATNAGNMELAQLVLNEAKRHLPSPQYQALLTSRTEEQFSVLQHAIISGDTALTRFICQAISADCPKQYEALLASSTKKNFSLLHDAVLTGNAELARFVFAEAKRVLTPDIFKQLLTQHTTEHWNLLHAATRNNESKDTPNPFMVDMIIDQIYDTFGKPEAKDVIRTLCHEKNNQGYYPVEEFRAFWLRAILDHYRPKAPSRNNASYAQAR